MQKAATLLELLVVGLLLLGPTPDCFARAEVAGIAMKIEAIASGQFDALVLVGGAGVVSSLMTSNSLLKTNRADYVDKPVVISGRMVTGNRPAGFDGIRACAHQAAQRGLSMPRARRPARLGSRLSRCWMRFTE